MNIPESIIKMYFLHGTKKRITQKLLSKLGLYWDGSDYIVEDVNLFEEKIWLFLSDQQKLDLLLEQQTKHSSEMHELKNNLKRLEDRLDNLRISTRIESSYDY